MTEQQRKIKDFMGLMGQNTPDQPTIPDEATRKLRAALILEECLETICKGLGVNLHISNSNGESIEIRSDILNKLDFGYETSGEPDLVELSDGIGDVYFVSHGSAVACGIDMEPIDAEIARSNASKLWKKEELGQVPEDATVEEFNGLYRVKRADGKGLKSPSYSVADILGELVKQGLK